MIIRLLTQTNYNIFSFECVVKKSQRGQVKWLFICPYWF